MGDINSSEISATLESSDYFFMSVDGKLRRVKVDNEVLRKIIAAGTTETLLCTGAETTLTLGKDYNVGDTLKFECLTTDTDLAEITYEISAESSSESGDDDELIDIGGTGIVTITPTLGTNTTDYTKVVVDSTMTSFTVNEYVTVYRIDGNIIVDSELSEESINPIQNKVVAKKIAEITVDVSVLSEKIYQNGMAINELSEGVDELSEGVGELSEKVNNYTETLLCTGAKTTLTLGEDYNVGDTLKFECLSADADFVEIFCATSTEGNFESITIDPTSDETAYVTVIVEDDMLSFTVNKVVTVYRIYSKVLIDSELSEESTNPVQNKVVAKKITEITNEISQLGQEKVDKNDISLGIASDGLMYIFVNGEPVGTGIPQGTVSDIYGYVDENNTIVLNGNLADGTYSLKYEMDNGNIVNIGNMVLDSTVYYSIASTLTKCTSNNSTKSIAEGNSYSATITANSGYSMSSIKVTMGGQDITSSAVSGNKITIASVTGNVVITATAVEVVVPTYTVTNNLTNCNNSNSVTSVQQGSAYSATITANSGYELKSVTATMGGSAVSVTNGVVNIASVTGNIVITAVAEITQEPTNFCVVNGDGWISGGRCSSSGANRTDSPACALTNYISVQNGDMVYVKNFTLNTNTYSGLYKADKTAIGGFMFASGAVTSYVKDVAISEGVGQFTIDNANAGYIRMCGYPTEGITNPNATSSTPFLDRYDINNLNIIVNIKRNGEWL